MGQAGVPSGVEDLSTAGSVRVTTLVRWDQETEQWKGLPGEQQPITTVRITNGCVT